MTPDERQHTLSGIVPSALPAFSELLEQAKAWGMKPRIVSALRTCDEQRSSAASKVYERSWHVLGRAVDLELHGSGAYMRLGQFWESMGGTWGGRWMELYPPDGDFMHFQWSAGRDGIPDSLWPKGERCETARERYLDSEATNPLPMAMVTPSTGLGRALLGSSAIPGAVALGSLIAWQRASGGNLSSAKLAVGAAVGGLVTFLWPLAFARHR